MRAAFNKIIKSSLSLYLSLIAVVIMLSKIRVDKLKISFLVIAALTILFVIFRNKINQIYRNIVIKKPYIISGVIVCIYLNSYCYTTLINSEFIINLFNKFSLPITHTALLVSFFGGLFSLISVSFIIQYILDDIFDINSIIREYKKLLQPIIILSIIIFLCLLALIRANYLYKDDMLRASTGAGFDVNSRYLSVFLSSFIHGGFYLTDVAPLTQFIAVVLISIASALMSSIFTGKKTIKPIIILPLTIFALSPYLLECYSYRYDAPYMMLSILMGMVPFIFISNNKKAYIVSSFLSAVLICISYQSSMCIYPTLLIIMCVLHWNKNDWSILQIINYIKDSIISYCGGLLFFFVFIMDHKKDYGYVSASILPIDKLLTGTIENYATYFNHVVSDFKLIWLLLIVGIIIFYIVLQSYNSKQNKLLSLMVNITCLMVCLLMSFSLFPILEKPSFEPRTMYGFTIFISMLSIICIDAFDSTFVKAFSICLGSMFISFCFTYGNALYAQASYTSYRLEMVLNDLNEIDYMNDDIPTIVQIEGTTGYAPIVNNMPQDYQMLNRLINCSFSEDSVWWGACGIYNYYGLENVVFDYNVNKNDYDLCTIKDTMYYTIKGNKDFILISLK